MRSTFFETEFWNFVPDVSSNRPSSNDVAASLDLVVQA
jgi:hypothetical protein